MNQKTAAEVLDQMERFQENGRAPSSIWQNNYRLGTVETVVSDRGEAQISAMMEHDPGMSYEQASNMVDWEDLRQEAEQEISRFDALHNPDQNAGGDPSIISGIDSSSINRAIGSQWGRGRSDELFQKIKEATKGMTREEMEHTRLNIKLNYSEK